MSPSRTKLNSGQKTTLIATARVYNNTAQVVINVTKDRAELILKEYEQVFHKQNRWQLPLGIFVSLLVSCLTTTASSVGPISSEIVGALLWALTGSSFIWYLYSYRQHHQERSGRGTIANVIDQLMNGQNEVPSQEK